MASLKPRVPLDSCSASGCPPLGIAAAAGLVLFFIGAILTHLRGHFYDFALPVGFLALATAALALRLATA